MRATIARWGRDLVALIALTALAACAVGREPAYDAALAGEITELTGETLKLFQDLTFVGTGSYENRAPRYRTLAAHAETVRLMAEARGSAIQPGGLMAHTARLAAGTALAKDIAPEAAERLAEYRDATAAYMADYLRNLRLLEEHDRSTSGDRSARLANYQGALVDHREAVEAYLEAFRAWQAGEGPQPEQPPAAPAPPAPGLDQSQVSLRLIALEDILRDTLIYERDILNRNR